MSPRQIRRLDSHLEEAAISAIPCITHYMGDVRPCTAHGEHLLTCSTPTCAGCWPRAARHGYVCEGCYRRIDEALLVADRMERELAGIDRAVRGDQDGGRFFRPGIPIPPVPLALDAIRSYRAEYRGNLLAWVSRQPRELHDERRGEVRIVGGAADAIRFVRQVHTEAPAHPTSELEHTIPQTRCPRCQRRSLKWRPPAHFLDLVQVACRDEACGFVADQSSFEVIARIERPTKAPAA